MPKIYIKGHEDLRQIFTDLRKEFGTRKANQIYKQVFRTAATPVKRALRRILPVNRKRQPHNRRTPIKKAVEHRMAYYTGGRLTELLVGVRKGATHVYNWVHSGTVRRSTKGFRKKKIRNRVQAGQFMSTKIRKPANRGKVRGGFYSKIAWELSRNAFLLKFTDRLQIVLNKKAAQIEAKLRRKRRIR